MLPTRIARPEIPSVWKAPTLTMRTGRRNAPAAADTVLSVIIVPNARPRSSSGTTRWKTVSRTTSITIDPNADTPIARRATDRSGVSPRIAAPAAVSAAPAMSGPLRLRRRTSTPETSAPIRTADADRGVQVAVRLLAGVQHGHRDDDRRRLDAAVEEPSMNWISRTPEKGRSGRRAFAPAAGRPRPRPAARASPAVGTSDRGRRRRRVADSAVVGQRSAARRRPARPIDGGSVQRIAAMTRNDRAFRMNAKTIPPAAISRPPIAGPRMKLTLPMLAAALFAGPSCRSSAARLGR